MVGAIILLVPNSKLPASLVEMVTARLQGKLDAFLGLFIFVVALVLKRGVFAASPTRPSRSASEFAP